MYFPTRFTTLCVVLLGSLYVSAQAVDAEEGISARELGLDQDLYEARAFDEDLYEARAFDEVEDLALRDDVLSDFSTRDLVEEIVTRQRFLGPRPILYPTRYRARPYGYRPAIPRRRF
ncbi:hypothetical protein CC1G_11020 [Coprinopsis cinerea okayama7|uniref:Uncharacterized protein n=1 Tax=Coprinopsis cinerea (strain Okayama-7 / 130 / ATCC MYA-4618 / FGSC 9003) TaxID=240176 RepID=A8NIQ9_COPC7|nr:hypothetical protein CC1G_11020 [Coprinopsis cinerea okayama7\|eukprot:XP_001834050.1 hypothetical protein CC1G_11020 [Coprinopsis cinerea okayama7\